MDAQIYIQNAMTYYNTTVKSETMSQRGLENMDYLKKTMRLKADTPHDITHCLEVRNIIENAEMILRASIQRKESRGRLFMRVDYPETDNENFFCWIGQRKDGEDVVWQKHYPK
jgi:succinate dehydrogenase/fumarate reductase flavoprotein subunit